MNWKGRTALSLAAAVAGALALGGCATRSRGDLVQDARCVDFSFQVYFEEQSAALTRAARTVISDAREQLRGCPTPGVEVVGLADYRGPADVNLALSRQRAEVVAGALARSGFATPSFRVLAAGEAGALTAAGEAEPMRRRAEIYVNFP